MRVMRVMRVTTVAETVTRKIKLVLKSLCPVIKVLQDIMSNQANGFQGSQPFIMDKEFQGLDDDDDDIKFSVKLREYIEGIIKKEKNIIYDYLLSLVSFAIKYFLNPTKDNLKIVDWYFIDLLIKKDKIIIRGMFYDLGLFIEDKVLVEGILELESRINEMNDSDEMDDSA